VHFGINGIGLVNVLTKDIAMLPEWQQRIWSAFNCGPDGGVSDELLASQARAAPANTKAPKAFLEEGLKGLDMAVEAKVGVRLRRAHEHVAEILSRCHRFRAVDKPGLFALAKDLARVTADDFDEVALKNALGIAKKERVRSLKALEQLAAQTLNPSDAKRILGPLVGIYDLRLADAHLPSAQISEAMALVGIDEAAPLVHQGYQILHAAVSTISAIAECLEKPSAE
jgi:hypothetical protein